MSSSNDTNVRLTSAERNSIIQNESRGIHHPLYYVCQTKSGKVQVRKRKTPLVNGNITSQAPTPQTPTLTAQPQQQAPTVDYNSVTNRELLERMLDVLQKNVNSNDEDKNSVENERITQENQQFIDNIVKANEPGVAASSSSIPTVHTEQPVVQPTRVVRRGRVLI